MQQHLAAAVLYTSDVLKIYRIQTLHNKEHYVLEVAVKRMGLDGSRHKVTFI
jgi:outer membrane protein assembly factor BamD (BamD/ComL family)